MSQVTRIIVADDHPIVRAGVRMLAESRSDLELVGEAGNAAETLSLFPGVAADILILDLWMGDGDGLEILPEIRSTAGDIKVLIYTMNDDGTTLRQ